MEKLDIVKELLQYIGDDAANDKALAQSCMIIMESEEERAEVKPKEPKKNGGRKAFDMGKLKALLEGGWSVPKIADEMKVSEQTIYNKMKQLEDK